MKKISILFVLLAIGFTAHAQKISFGFKGGLNSSWVTGDESDGVTPRIGVHLGVMSEFSLSEKFSLQPELVYSQQGAQQDVAFISQGMTIAETELKARHNYLNLPILAKYYVAKNFSIEAGPQIGFLLSAEQEGNGVEVDAKSALKNIDFAASLGVSYKFDSGLNFSARYNAGLSNVNDIDGVDDKNYNGVLQISIGYFLK
ncbi:outer membrane protein with beta-barrel domain [Kordia periserrulae]|uniref:Outer membrane protein with beta-barrel domain n=1 Tax=Kordia periserrulae TaxID=701523 RepID=A0A2T6C2U3_9FLAO|nr:porin family protein [Kordia periserrulae]PTX62646.1 outer membrane protein with beta-barrel domain [Kordia periserrulae]